MANSPLRFPIPTKGNPEGSKVWELAINEWTPALPPSHLELKVLVGSITTRKVTRRGVEFEGLLYNSSELARLRSSLQSTQKTTVKYDPTDLSRIYVLDPTTHQFLSDWLKDLILDTKVPMVLIGLPEAETVFQFNPQLSRRFANRHNLSPFEWSADVGKEFRTFLHAVLRPTTTRLLSGFFKCPV